MFGIRRHALIPALLALFCGPLCLPTLAADQVGPDAKLLKETRQKGIDYLKANQNADGSWSQPKIIGITALVTTSLLESGLSPEDPTVSKALQFLLQYTQDDGGIYHPETRHRNYETSITLMALVEANRDGRYDSTIEKATKFLRGLQWDESEQISEDDPAYGGAGYGSHSRPDLSNTQFMLEALQKTGLSVDDPAFQKAAVFVSRCQNLESEHNQTPFASKVKDGGFYYTPAAGGTSQAGDAPNGGLRSYAAMTYAGLKSLLYAGVSKDDKRVQAAQNWLKQHYSVEENPGMGQQGLYYYYHVFAKTLSTLGTNNFETADGQQHDWRKDLTRQLNSEQRSDGSWVNDADRWYEGDPALVTAYSLLALAYCDPNETGN